MTPAETAVILRQFNAWHRGGDTKQPGLLAVGEAIDAAVEMIDRLEEAETAWKEADKACRDLTEKVIPNLRENLEAAERDVALKERVIDALGSELNAVAKERDALRNEIACVKEVEFPRKAQAVADVWKGKCERLEAERDALRAKIEQMEQQEPVGTLHDDGYFVWRKTAPYESNYGGWKMALYALPGAKGE